MTFVELCIEFLSMQLTSEAHACSIGSRCSWCFVAQQLSGRNSPAGKWIIWYSAFISWKRLFSLSLFESDLLICRFIHLSLADDVIPIFFSPELQPAVGYGGRHYLGPSDLRLIRTKGGFWARERQAELQRPWHESRRVGCRNTGSQPVAAGGLWEWDQGDGNRHTGATVRKMSPVGEGIHGLLQQRQRHFPTIQRRRTMPSQGIPHWSISIICLAIDWLIDRFTVFPIQGIQGQLGPRLHRPSCVESPRCGAVHPRQSNRVESFHRHEGGVPGVQSRYIGPLQPSLLLVTKSATPNVAVDWWPLAWGNIHTKSKRGFTHFLTEH